jgi:hypothetical protein
MEQNVELRRAILQEQIKICKSMMALGYYPYKIRFGHGGNFEIEGREACDSDQKLIEAMVKDLSSIDAETTESPSNVEQ